MPNSEDSKAKSAGFIEPMNLTTGQSEARFDKQIQTGLKLLKETGRIALSEFIRAVGLEAMEIIVKRDLVWVIRSSMDPNEGVVLRKKPVADSEDSEDTAREPDPLEVHADVIGKLDHFEKMKPGLDQGYHGLFETYSIRVKLVEFDEFSLVFDSQSEREKALWRLGGCKGKQMRVIRYGYNWYGITCGPRQQDWAPHWWKPQDMRETPTAEFVGLDKFITIRRRSEASSKGTRL